MPFTYPSDVTGIRKLTLIATDDALKSTGSSIIFSKQKTKQKTKQKAPAELINIKEPGAKFNKKESFASTGGKRREKKSEKQRRKKTNKQNMVVGEAIVGQCTQHPCVCNKQNCPIYIAQCT